MRAARSNNVPMLILAVLYCSMLAIVAASSYPTLYDVASGRYIQQQRQQRLLNDNVRDTGAEGDDDGIDGDDDGTDSDDDTGDDTMGDDDDSGTDNQVVEVSGVDDNAVIVDDDYSGEAGDDKIPYDYDAICQAIASGTAVTVTDENGYQVLTYQIDLALEIDGDVTETLARLQDFLQSNIATDLAGCNDDGTADDSDVKYVLFDVTEDKTSEPYCANCTNADITADVQYTSDGDSTVIEGAIYDAFIDRCSEMKDIEGVVDTFDPCPTIEVKPIPAESDDTEPPVIIPVDDEIFDDSNSTDGVIPAPIVTETQKSSSEKDISGAGIFGIILALLLLLALLALFVRRRRRAYLRRSNKLGHDDTFVMDDGLNTSNNVNSPGRYSDEDDSMIDSRYGMYPEGQNEKMILGNRIAHQDVHKCTSATCNICEARRRDGRNIQFLPTNGGQYGIRPPPPPTPLTAAAKLPTIPDEDADDNAVLITPVNEEVPVIPPTTNRSYSVRDTVLL